jgi:hypothetical protein
MTQWMPCRVDPLSARVERGHPVVDGYLELVVRGAEHRAGDRL